MSYQLNLKGSYENTLTTRAVWHDGSFLYACTDAGVGSELRKLTHVAGVFTSVADVDTGFAISAIYGDGTYLYGFGGTTLYAFNKTTLATIASLALGLAFASFICAPDGYIYAMSIFGILRAYSFDGVNFAYRGTITPTGSTNGYAVFTNGTHIFALFSGSGTLISRCDAFTFDGTNFTLVASSPSLKSPGGQYAQFALHDGTYIYFAYAVASSPDMVSYSFDGAWHAIQSSNVLAGDAAGLATDGQYIYVAERITRVGIYSHSAGSGFVYFANYADAGIQGSSYSRQLIICIAGGYIIYISGSTLKSIRLDLVASFTVDVISGNISIPRNFTAT